MKKTLLALAGAIVLLVLVLGVKNCADRRMSRELFVFDTAKVAQVERLEISYGGETAVLVKRGAKWFTSGDDYPVDSLRMHRVLNALLRTRATEKVSESGNAERLVEFGLNEAEAKRVRWKLASGEQYTLLLGKTSGTDYSSSYWKWEDAKEVYRTPGNFTHEASVRESDWKTRQIFPFFLYEDVASVSVDWVDSTGKTVHYRIDRTSDSSAVLVEPFKSAIPRRSAGEIYLQTPQFTSDALVESWEDRAAMKLDTPQFKIAITMKDKTVHRLVAGAPVREGTLLYRYTRLPGTNHVVKVFEWRYAFFRKTPDQLMNPPPLPPDTPDLPEDAVETIDPSQFEEHSHDH